MDKTEEYLKKDVSHDAVPEGNPYTKEKLWNKNFINACAANFLIACSFYLLMPTIPIYLSEQLLVPESKIGIVLSSYVLALLLIRPFSGYLVDVYPRKPLFLLGVSLFVAMFFGYYFAVTILFFVVLRFIHGLFWGVSTVSANTVAIDIIPPSRRAEGIGFFGVNMNIAMAIAPYIAVNIYESYGFPVLITSAIAMGVLAVFAVNLIDIPKEKAARKPPVSFDRFILIKAIPIFINQLFLSFGWGTLIAFAVLYGKRIGIHNPGIFFLIYCSRNYSFKDKLRKICGPWLPALGYDCCNHCNYHRLPVFCIFSECLFLRSFSFYSWFRIRYTVPCFTNNLQQYGTCLKKRNSKLNLSHRI